jgi:hypothetical protein
VKTLGRFVQENVAACQNDFMSSCRETHLYER